MTTSLLTVSQLSKNQILHILDQAQIYINTNAHLTKKQDALQGKTIALLFFEASTRTRCSFELASKRLDAEVLNIDLAHSSTIKGETLLDTCHTLEAMGIDAFVIRHSQPSIPKFVAENLKSSAVVINAGDGHHAHPTQGLLDMLTIRQYKKTFENLSVAIIGDILHSRVAASDLAALEILGVKDIRLIGPANLIPTESHPTMRAFSDINAGIENVDVIICLRIQKERMSHHEIPNLQVYFEQYGLTQQRLQLAKSNVIVMHPGPINRHVEIDSQVADGEHSAILQQVSNGVALRMSVLKELLI